MGLHRYGIPLGSFDSCVTRSTEHAETDRYPWLLFS